jgi:hypothetical protein
LAELARIVGQEDPFHDLLSRDRSRTPAREPANLDDIFAPRAAVGGRGSASPARDSGQPAPVHSGYAAPQADYRQPDEAYSAAYEDERDPEPAYSVHDVYLADDEQPAVAAPRAARSRKGAIAVGAVLATAALGLGGVLLLDGRPTALTGGEPPLVKASNEPIKVQPQSPGGVEIPNQNKQIYERNGTETQTKIANREEQPVDVRQAARAAQGANTEATGATTASPPSGNGLNLGEPRRVRTITIRPDGTPVTETAGPRAAPAVPPSAMAPPQAAQPAPQRMAAGPSTNAAGVQNGQSPTAPSTSPARPAPATPAAGGTSTQAAAPANTTAAPQRVAAAQPAPVAAAPAAAEAGGGFAVQLAVGQSEADARATFQQLQRKYADLGQHALMIHKAEVNGSTIYRVRVGPMSRNDASSLCSKIQGQGGQCFVAKN